MTGSLTETVAHALNRLCIELPSWGFANTGTRFGKFLQPAAAVTIEEKFSDAGQVHALTGSCPTIALHVLWDLPHGLDSVLGLARLSARYGVTAGSINPNYFQDQIYKFGSFGNPDPEVRSAALRHTVESIEIAKRAGSRDVSLWFADGSNYPGSAAAGSRNASAPRTSISPPPSACSSNTSPSSRPSITPTSPIGAWRCS